MTRQDFRTGLCQCREILGNGARRAGVQFPPAALEQGRIGGVEDQRVLEKIGRFRRRAADVDQFRVR